MTFCVNVTFCGVTTGLFPLACGYDSSRSDGSRLLPCSSYVMQTHENGNFFSHLRFRCKHVLALTFVLHLTFASHV